MIFRFGQTLLDIDVEATRKFYSERNLVNDCSCTGCENYRHYVENCAPAIKEMFRSMGIEDLRYISEIIPYGAGREEYQKSGRILYGGFYHVKGRVIQRGSEEMETSAVKLTEHYEIYPPLEEGGALVPDDFPTPVLQIEIYAQIPWLISAENDYV